MLMLVWGVTGFVLDPRCHTHLTGGFPKSLGGLGGLGGAGSERNL